MKKSLKKKLEGFVILMGADYDLINQLPFNRESHPRDDLKKSMQKYGNITAITVIQTDVISGVMDYYIADGGNRYATAIQLELPVYAYVSKMDFATVSDVVKFVASLNSTQKKWDPDDYCRAYSYLNFADYKTLLKLKSDWGYNVTTVSMLLTGVRQRGVTKKAIQDGTFKITTLKEAQYTYSLVLKLMKYGKKPTARMVIALNYVTLLKNFEETKFIAQYAKHYKCIMEKHLDDYTSEFESWL